MNKREKNRMANLLPHNIPKYIRCYDNPDFCDRYTCVFSGSYNNIGRSNRGLHSRGEHPYLAMSGAPYQPQGFCQHGSTQYKCCDVNDWGFAPAMGRKCHLGLRIPFDSLPKDCQKIAIENYMELWEIKKD